MMAVEASIQLEQLGNGLWLAHASARVIGRDATPRAREFRASNYASLFSDITEFLDGIVPRPDEALPTKKRSAA